MFFVFDVETIPDFSFLRNVLNDSESSDDDLLLEASEQLTRNNSGFLPPMYHRMVSWVGLWVENTGKPVQKVGWNGENEKEGLTQLFDALLTYKDFGLIHHNGRGFDLPLVPIALCTTTCRCQFASAITIFATDSAKPTSI